MDADTQLFLRDILEKQDKIGAVLNELLNQVKNKDLLEIKEELKTIHVKIELIRQQLKSLEEKKS